MLTPPVLMIFSVQHPVEPFKQAKLSKLGKADYKAFRLKINSL
jgi:hypothetical protein